jgi:hypothetical protein
MRQLPVLLLSFGVLAAFGQTPSDSKRSIAEQRIELASRALARIQTLADMGAESRARLEQARQDLADAQDEAVLDRALQQNLSSKDASGTETETADAVGAAQRRLDREKTRVEEAEKLMAAGLASQSYLTPFENELTTRQIQLDLARSREQWMRDRLALAKSPELQPTESTAAGSEPATEYADVFTGAMEHYEGDGAFDEARELKPIEHAFEEKFDRPLPISADGETGVHRALGLDHRGRVDVAVAPDSPEGVWLRRYLQLQKIPYYAFTRAIPGKATGAHIHIGPGSARLLDAD